MTGSSESSEGCVRSPQCSVKRARLKGHDREAKENVEAQTAPSIERHVEAKPATGYEEQCISLLGRCLLATRAYNQRECVLSERPFFVVMDEPRLPSLVELAQRLCEEDGPSAFHDGAEMRWDLTRVSSLLAFLEASHVLPRPELLWLISNFDSSLELSSPVARLVEATVDVLHAAHVFTPLERTDLRRLCFIKVVNCHQDTRGGAALYSVLSRVAHSCAPNCIYAPRDEGVGEGRCVGRLVAVRPIEPGDLLSINYLPRTELLIAPRAERRAAIFAARGFHCECSVCRGPETWRNLHTLSSDCISELGIKEKHWAAVLEEVRGQPLMALRTGNSSESESESDSFASDDSESQIGTLKALDEMASKVREQLGPSHWLTTRVQIHRISVAQRAAAAPLEDTDLTNAVASFVEAASCRDEMLKCAGISPMLLDDLGRDSQFAKTILLIVWRAAQRPDCAPAGVLEMLRTLRSGTWPVSFEALGVALQKSLVDLEAAFGNGSEEVEFGRRIEGEWAALRKLSLQKAFPVDLPDSISEKERNQE